MVVAVIGVLAGVTVAVINPQAQRNRVNDANIQAFLIKSALTVDKYIALNGVVPNATEFFDGMVNVARHSSGAGCDGGHPTYPYICIFSVNNYRLPSNCHSTGGVYNRYTGTGNVSCNIRYEGTSGTANYYIYAKSTGKPNTVFRYNGSAGVIETCDATLPPTNCVAP